MSSLGVDHLIEFVAALLSMVYLYLEVKENSWLWLVGIVSSALYAYVYFYASFYADFGLMIYYVIISIYGWLHWNQNSDGNHSTELPIRRITLLQSVYLLIIGGGIYAFLLTILLYLPGYIGLSSSAFPYLDSFTVAASVIGTWMLTRKILEQWLVWIVVNCMCIVMFWLKELNFTTILFIVYLAGSVVGYIRWKNHYKIQLK